MDDLYTKSAHSRLEIFSIRGTRPMPCQTLVNIRLYPQERRHLMPQTFRHVQRALQGALLGRPSSGTLFAPRQRVLDWMAEEHGRQSRPVRQHATGQGPRAARDRRYLRGPDRPGHCGSSPRRRKSSRCDSVSMRRSGVPSVRWAAQRSPELPRGDDAEAVLFDGHDEGPKRQSVEWEDWEITHNG